MQYPSLLMKIPTFCKLFLLPKSNWNMQLATHILPILKYTSKHNVKKKTSEQSTVCNGNTDLSFNLSKFHVHFLIPYAVHVILVVWECLKFKVNLMPFCFFERQYSTFLQVFSWLLGMPMFLVSWKPIKSLLD